MRHLTASLLVSLSAVAAMLLPSCSGQHTESRLLGAIPAESSSVIFYNLDALAEAGTDPHVLAPSSPGRFLPLAKGLTANVVLADGLSFSLAEAPEADSLSAAGFTADGESRGDLTAYTTPGGVAAVVDGKQSIAYYFHLSGSRALDRAAAIAEAASKLPFSAYKGLANEFDKSAGKAIFGAVSPQGTVPSGDDIQSARWLTLEAEPDGSDGVAVNAALVEGSGNPVEIKGLTTIDTDFLRYLPADLNVVAAAGLTPDIDWNAAASFVTPLAGPAAMYLAAALPYLKSIDGTVAIGVGASDTDISLSSMPRLFVMVHMDRDKIAEIMSQIGTLASMGGATTAREGDNIVRVTLPGTTPVNIYAGNIDGNLAISTSPLDGLSQNSYAPDMEGHDAALSASLPGSFTDGGQLPKADGLNLTVAIDGNRGTVRMALPGADVAPISLLAGALAR